MSRLNSLVIALSLGLLVNCGQVPNGPTDDSGSLRATSTINAVTERPSTLTPSSFATSTAIVPNTPAQRCLPVEQNATLNSVANGTLLLSGSPPRLLNIETGTEILLPVSNTHTPTILGIEASPDNGRLAYVEQLPLEAQGSIENQLMIIDAAGKQIAVRDWSPDWLGWRWLNDQQLVTGYTQRVDGTRIVIDPMTGDMQTLTPSFPNVYRLEPFHLSPLVEYDTGLTRVVYLRDGLTFALWDIQSDSVLWESMTSDPTIPKWSPDSERVAVALAKQAAWQSELYTIDRNGQETQLTRYSSEFPVNLIPELAWSPNGRYIAFWSDHRESIGQDPVNRVTLVDTMTGQLVDYCLMTYETNPHRPIWSPDSNQFIVTLTAETDLSIRNAILIDVATNRAYQLSVGMLPIAWLVNPATSH